ncbi:dihydrodipicolinate synthase family protein, partial [Variovorax sp. CT11-76]
MLAPVLTPFDAALKPDAARFLRLCRWLVAQDCGLAMFGTNSEGNSLSVDERIELLRQAVAAGVPA